MSVGSRLHCAISYDLGGIRERVRGYARRAGLDGDRLNDLVLAVNEAVTNVLDHGGGAGVVTAAREGSGIIVEIVDTAGVLAPRHLSAARSGIPTRSRGIGLWLIQRLCDGVTLDHPQGRSRLRLRMNLGEDRKG
ncbi:ATP-binding protein [Nonomuraea sp. SBT364]|uniref:ATP-binding protein n=1 Tax=Nonomuraea sp. SBT364 TaxID=1580530 RepID=UPI00066B3E8D|nr:ATP-binding protein [Nonomuraea sp. SBT364]